MKSSHYETWKIVNINFSKLKITNDSNYRAQIWCLSIFILLIYLWYFFNIKITLLLSLANLLDNSAISPIKATEETLAQTSAETQTEITVKHGTLEEIRIQPTEECQNQMVDESEIFVSENIRSPSAKETRTLSVESTETQVTAEAQVPLAGETSMRAVEATESGVTGISKILSVKKTQTQATIESTNLAKDETLVQPSEETCKHTETTELKYTQDTEDADIEFPETYVAENTEEGEPLILNGN